MLLLSLFLFLFCVPAAFSADAWLPGSGSGAGSNEPYAVSTATGNLPNARVIRSQNSFIDISDSGSGYLDWDLNGALGLVNGGTGATTQQGAANAVLGFTGLTTGDIFYYNGTNITRLAKGGNNTVIGVDGSGTFGYYTPSGGGTVTNFSAGDLSPLFTTSEADTTSTPALTFTLSNAGAWEIFGRHAGGSGAPSYATLQADHIPNLSANKITSDALAKARQHAATVYNDASNTFTGTFTQDISDANQTLLIPLRAAPSTNGAISVNSGDFEFRASGATHKAAKQATTVSAGTGLTGGGDISANRTISLSTPVSAANGGTGANLSGASNGAVPYVSSGALTTLSPSANAYIKFNAAGNAIETGTPGGGGFGGDGSAGAVTKGATTETTVLQINATTFSQTASTTYQPKSGTIINTNSTATFNGTTTVGVAGGRGLSPGTAASNSGNGGGGGGNAGAGGDGHGVPSYLDWGYGGPALSSPMFAGSAGGRSDTTAGGAGGGRLTVCSIGAISIASGGNINAVGANGPTGTNYAGGGGSGGTIILASQTSIAQTGTASVAGGDGGAASAGGGGGGGGFYVRISPSNTGSGTITVSGGAAGSGGSPAAGSSGTAMAITATPNLPLIGAIERNLPVIAVLHRMMKPSEQHDQRLSESEIVHTLAALESKGGNFHDLCHLYRFGEDFHGSKIVRLESKQAEKMEALRNAS